MAGRWSRRSPSTTARASTTSKGKHDEKGKGSEYVQIAGQEASNYQSADADAVALQVKPSNTNESVRVGSRGDDGDVSQSNSTTALAAALNLNETKQSIDQTQTGGGHGGSYMQVAGQGAWSAQKADADATAVQLGASNENAPIRVGSHGGGGSVEQSNDVGALALALNLNETQQYLDQTQSGHGSDSLQVAGQGSWSEQRGGAMSRAIQGGMRKKQQELSTEGERPPRGAAAAPSHRLTRGSDRSTVGRGETREGRSGSACDSSCGARARRGSGSSCSRSLVTGSRAGRRRLAAPRARRPAARPRARPAPRSSAAVRAPPRDADDSGDAGPAAAPVPTPDAPVVAADAQHATGARAPRARRRRAGRRRRPRQPALEHDASSRTGHRRRRSSVVTTRADPTTQPAPPSGSDARRRSNEGRRRRSRSRRTRGSRVVRARSCASRTTPSGWALPVGALIVGRPGAGPTPDCSSLAALLLVTAAAGTLVAGARRPRSCEATHDRCSAFARCSSSRWRARGARPSRAAPHRHRPSPRCNGGGCGGWFKSAVTVTWEFDPAGVTSTSGCAPTGVTDDTGGHDASRAPSTTEARLRQQRDRAEGLVAAADERQPSRATRTPTAGTRSPSPSGSAGTTAPRASPSCSGSGTYGGPDGGAITLTGTCSDNAGNSASSR